MTKSSAMKVVLIVLSVFILAASIGLYAALTLDNIYDCA